MPESKKFYDRSEGALLRYAPRTLKLYHTTGERVRNFLTRLVASIIVAGVVLFGYCSITLAQQQSDDYHIEVRPDIWYNAVDGIRTGLLLRGQTVPTIAVTPRDFTIGLWAGTRWPQYPFSYYLNWKEPLTSVEQLDNQSYLNTVSSIRTGLQNHQLSVFQRWKYSESVFRFLELNSGFDARRRFSLDYVQYPQLWQQDWLTSFYVDVRSQLQGQVGRLTLRVENSVNFPLDYSSFTRSVFELAHRRTLGANWSIRSRLFAGLSSANTPPEMLWMRSIPSPYEWTQRGLFRARGTVPESWINRGIIQPVGGPYLRGYFSRDVKVLAEGGSPLHNKMTAINMEFQFPNPVNSTIEKIPILDEFLNVSSYLFYDAGTSFDNESPLYSDTGLGLELKVNIPDFRQKPRGFFIRYDIPFWLSHTAAGRSPLQYRYLIGIGSVFTL